MDSVYSVLTRTLKLASLSLLLLAVVLPATAQETKTVIKEGQEFKMKYNEALTAAKGGDLNTAYDAFGEAVTLAEAAGETDIVTKSRGVMAQIDNKRGNAALKKEDFNGALELYERGIGLAANYAPNHYGKAKAMQKLGQTDEALALFKEVIDMGHRKSANAATKTIRDHFMYLASSSLNSNNGNPSRSDAESAITAMSDLGTYVELDSDGYYYLAEANKVLGDYEQAIENADKALEINRKSVTDKAKIYFVKGESYMFMGSNQQAIDAFTNALYGNFKSSAQYHLDELKSSGD